MDGPTLSAGGGGFEIASGYVTVGVDLEPARQEIAQFRGELANLFQGGMTIGAGAGSYGAAGAQFSAPAGGMSAVGNTIGIGGGMSAQKIEIDTSQAQQSVQQLTGSVKELKDQLALLESAASGFTSRGAAVPSNIASEIAGLRAQIGGTTRAPSGGQMAAPAGIAGNVVDNGWAFGMGVAGYSGYDMASMPSAGHSLLSSPMVRPMRRHLRPSRLMDEAAEMYGAAPASMGLAAPAEYFAMPEMLDEGDEVSDVSMISDALATRPRRRGPSRGQRTGGFGLYGALSRATGLPYAGVIAGAMAIDAAEHLTVGYLQAADIAGHPEANLLASNHPGSLFDPFSSPASVADAGEMASIQASTIRWGAWGVTGQLFDTQRFNRQRQLEAIGRRGAFEQYLPQRVSEVGIRAAQAISDPVGVARLQGAAQVAIAAHDYGIAGAEFGYDSEQYRTAGALYEQTKRMADYGVQDAQTSLQTMALTAHATFLAANPTLTRAGRDLGSVFRALNEEQIAAHARMEAGLVGPTAAFNRARENSDLDAMKAASAQAAQVRADYRNQQAGITSQQLGALYDAESLARNTGAEMQSMLLSARGNSFGARMTQFEAQSERLRLDATPYGIDLRGAIAIERRTLQGRHSFDMALEGEGLTARSAAAQAEMGLEPLNAQATLDVARARHEIAMSPPELRGQTQATVAAELRARQHLQTAQRGGEVAIDSSLYEAMGTVTAMGIDLTGQLRDRLAAGKTYENGIGNLGSSPDASKMVNVTDKEAVEALNKIVNFLQKFKPTGVTMFN